MHRKSTADWPKVHKRIARPSSWLGIAVVLISNNLEDVFATADRIEVLRLGRNAGNYPGSGDHAARGRRRDDRRATPRAR